MGFNYERLWVSFGIEMNLTWEICSFHLLPLKIHPYFRRQIQNWRITKPKQCKLSAFQQK